MGRYTIIADTGEKLVSLLQRELVPEVIGDVNEIGMRSPEDHGDVSLGVFLYDVRESEEVRQPGAAVVRGDRLTKPPVYLTLYYMITAYSKGEAKYRLAQEERILGKVIQTFHDYSLIPIEELEKNTEGGFDVRISLISLTPDEKSKVWNFPNMGNQVSLFYKVTPVAIDSGLSEDAAFVREKEISVSEYEREDRDGL